MKKITVPHKRLRILEPKDVREIRRELKAHQREKGIIVKLAVKKNVTPATISAIKRHITWKWLK